MIEEILPDSLHTFNGFEMLGFYSVLLTEFTPRWR
jgi:hypothetical protein